MREKNDSGIPADDSDALMQCFAMSGDEKDFAAIVRLNTDRFYRVAKGLLQSSAEAEDAVQECFIRIIKTRHSFKQGNRFAPWAFAILRHYCIDEVRSAWRRLKNDKGLPEDFAGTECTDQPMFDRERAKVVMEALAKLPENERTAIALRIYGNMDFANIGAACGISEDAAKKRFYRGLQVLEEPLEKLL